MFRANGCVGVFGLDPFYSLATKIAFDFHGNFQALPPDFSMSIGNGSILWISGIGSPPAIVASRNVFLRL